MCRLAAPGALQQGYEAAWGRWLHIVGHWMALGTRCLFIWQKGSCFSLSGLCHGGTALQATGPEQSLRLRSLYSLLGLYFQDFSGKIKPLKNTPYEPGWDDCTMNVSHKANASVTPRRKTPPGFHMYTAAGSVFNANTKCLVFWTFKWIQCRLVTLQSVLVCPLFIWHLSEGGTHHMCAVSRL